MLGIARNRTLINCTAIQSLLLIPMLLTICPSNTTENIFIIAWIVIVKGIILTFLTTRSLHSKILSTPDKIEPSPIPMILGPILSRLIGVFAFLAILGVSQLTITHAFKNLPAVSLEVALFILFVSVFIFISRPAPVTQLVASMIFSNGLYLLAFYVTAEIKIDIYILIILDLLNIIIASILSYFELNGISQETQPLHINKKPRGTA